MVSYFVYLIKTRNKINNKYLSYVGYTNNLSKRIRLHNQGKGAKYTRGKKWKLVYFLKFSNKSMALKEEHKLKKNRKLRASIKNSNFKKTKID
tara:strand:+ start:4796 stop:5074 length:279 start_codon:yes stop_codon:yes gene_type:complete